MLGETDGLLIPHKTGIPMGSTLRPVPSGSGGSMEVTEENRAIFEAGVAGTWDVMLWLKRT